MSWARWQRLVRFRYLIAASALLLFACAELSRLDAYSVREEDASVLAPDSSTWAQQDSSLEAADSSSQDRDSSLDGADSSALGDASTTGDASPDQEAGADCEGIGDSSCASCLRRDCCAETTACRNDATCARHADCLAQCPREDGECVGGCFGEDKSFATQRWLACTMRRCASVCLGCASLGPVGGDCTSCATRTSCKQARDCLANADCREYAACLFEHCEDWALDPACRMKCGDADLKRPGAVLGSGPGPGRKVFLRWAAQLGMQCTSECRFGQHWQCADPHLPDLPLGEGGKTTDVSVRIVNGLTRVGVAGLSVEFCRDTDAACEASSAQTDANGFATLQNVPESTLAPGLVPASRYFEVSAASGGRQLVYAGRSFTAAKPTLELMWVPALESSADFGAPGQGVLVVPIADCMGSFDAFVRSPSATASLVGSDRAPFYVSAFDPAGTRLERGPIAVFGPLAPGNYAVEIRDPQARVVATLTVRVEADAFTLLYVTFPFLQ